MTSAGTSRRADVLIVGAGQAGAQAAISLRQGGFAGSILLIGDEPDLPYERPPLSKEYLTGEKSQDRLLLRTQAFWEQRAVALQLGETVTAVDAEAHSVRTASGTVLHYGRMVWAAGGKARPLPLPGGHLDGVYTIRSRQDVDAFRNALAGANHIAIIGAGYIGLEVAPALRKIGKQVTVLESQGRVLARVTSPVVSSFYESEHRKQGVQLRLGASIAGLLEAHGRVAGVRFLDGAPDLQCDAVVVAIGIVPTVQPLEAAGAITGNGVEVDSYCQTSLADILAIGDCASHVNRYASNTRVRIESVQNAVDQAKVAAGVILDQPQPYASVPWFWSNQYDIRLQTAGLCTGCDSQVLRGDPASRSFSVVYLKSHRVIALDCINAARDFVQGKALVERGALIEPARLADATQSLKSMVDAG